MSRDVSFVGRTRAHIQIRGIYSSVSGRIQKSDTCVDGEVGQIGTNRSLWVCVFGGACGRTGTVGACVGSPTGHGLYGACPERTDMTQSLWGETHSHGKCLRYRAGLASEVTAG